MWRFLIGFASGVYAGTYYDCKPILRHMEKNIKEYIPDRKNKN
jgi:hypothetical protein|tara:strand:+ start:2832 stop:2960 length:129 start_codon:yes stop_codon:yes gene_type:complete